ncbi:MAG: quinone-dependent dihydroorotate dehydrogenase [Candidatus Thermoplasmatota archaeon]
MYGALKSALFRLDPERAHEAALRALRGLHVSPPMAATFAPAAPDPRLATKAFGLHFQAPLGMAAGFDKGAWVYNGLLALGFSHVEVGTITPKPQPGNEGMRMERLPDLKALVNRLGFPNVGVEEAVRRLGRRPPHGVVGANIGPNKKTPAENVSADIDACAFHLAAHVDYLTINVSSPNTPGLRKLQEPAAVARLVGRTLEAVAQARAVVPVLLKLHPDAPDEELVEVAKAAVDAGADGIVATNTTRARPPGSEGAIEGGLSGAPLLERSRAAIRALHDGLGRDTPIIGVGGIANAHDAMGHILAGATVVQAYTGFIYDGPRFPAHVHAGLVGELDALGFDKVGEAVGRGV